MKRARAILVWSALGAVIAVPLAFAAASDLLQWRSSIYITGGFAGIVAMALLLVQPLLAGGYLPGLDARRTRQVHRITGGLLVAAVVLHVAGLWATSPPDVIDALLFRSPTPFSAWGVIAMVAVFAAGLAALLRRRLRLRPPVWRLMHTGLAAVTVTGSVVHAMLIEGAMETVTKAGLCALVVLAAVKVFADLRIWAVRAPRR